MSIVESSRRDVWFNLALEEHLLDHRDKDQGALLLYVNDESLVLGKNQNPWRECDVARARRENVPVARRFTGGGTVYHDRGNLNYSFILPRASYDKDGLYALVIRALGGIGIRAERQGKSSLAAGGKKISGTAFCFRRDSAVHHGTLLVNSDLSRMAKLLRPSLPEIETRAISSVPAAVTNLADLVHGLVIEQVADALCAASNVDRRRVDESDFDVAAIEARAKEIAAWDYAFGMTPRFSVNLGPLDLEIAHGLIERASASGVDLNALHGCRFGKDEIVVRLRKTNVDIRAVEAIDF